ncbi:MAG TPA: type II secretion system protein N [Gammaproteobacteria bacterium]|nr:type II secretion system protein N [Gammaproteobacteria bacterium]
MSWSWRIFAGAGLLALAAFLVAGVPARVAWTWWGPHGHALKVSGISGTVWNGSASRVAFGSGSLGDIRWQLRPSSLFMLRLGYRFRARLQQGYINGDAALTPSGRLRLDHVEGQSNIGVLGALINAGQIPVRGQVNLQLETLTWKGGHPTDAAGRVSVSDVTLDMGGQEVALGQYRITLGRQGKRIMGNIRDRGGPLQVSGDASLTPGGLYRVELAITQRQPGSQLHNLLGMLGRPDPGGAYHLRLNGRI